MSSSDKVVLKIELIRAAAQVLNGPLDATSEPYKAARSFLISAWNELRSWSADDEVRTAGTVAGPAVVSTKRPAWAPETGPAETNCPVDLPGSIAQ